MASIRTVIWATILASMLVLAAPVAAQDSAPKAFDPNNIPQARIGHWDDIIYGDPKAPVEIIEFVSLTCSHCGNFATNIFPLLKAKYLNSGKAVFRLRNFSWNQFDLTLSVVARCKDNDLAGKLTKDFLTRQNEWMAKGANASEILMGIAAKHGIDKDGFESCLQNEPLTKHLISERARFAGEYKFQGTPGVFIDGVYIGEPLWEKIDAAIQKALNK